jgi:hypothetical protein
VVGWNTRNGTDGTNGTRNGTNGTANGTNGTRNGTLRHRSARGVGKGFDAPRKGGFGRLRGGGERAGLETGKGFRKIVGLGDGWMGPGLRPHIDRPRV